MPGAAEVREAVGYLAPRLSEPPRAAIILGSGLSAVAQNVEHAQSFPAAGIPHWPASSAVGHPGRIVFGRLAGTPVMVVAGRVHLYEGYTAAEVMFGVRVAARLGAQVLLATNAAGAINQDYSPGDLVLISDHINLLGESPLTGPQDPFFGERHVDLTTAYDPRLRDHARASAAKLGFSPPEGVYAAVRGPNYETPAEIRFLRAIGADLVGMSTVPEVIAARQLGLRVLAISCVTNMAAGIRPVQLSHKEVLAVGKTVQDRFSALISQIAGRLD